MDSDDEFDNPMPIGSKVIDGLNFKELLETGCTNFEVADQYVDLEEDVNLTKEQKRERDQKKADEALEEAYENQFKGPGVNKTFRGLDKYGKVLCDSDTSYSGLAKRMTAITEDGGVKKLIIEPGAGKDLIVAGNVVYIHYTVCIESREEPIDDSKTHTVRGRKEQPFRFKVGLGLVIPLFDIAIATMQRREKAMFLADYKYAYGKLGSEPRIPAETSVMVTIEVVGIEEGSTKFNLIDLEREERLKLSFDELYKGVKELKVYGNDSFKVEEYDKARKEYKKALKILHDIMTPIENENKMKLEMSYTLYINIAQCEIFSNNLKKAKEYCETAIAIPIPKQKKLKAYFRLAKVLDELGDVFEAKEKIMIATSLDASNKEVLQLYNKICKKISKDESDEREYAKKIFQHK